MGLRWIEAGNDDEDGGENGGLVELVGLVLWWAGDKEMMVLGGGVDVVWLLVGGIGDGFWKGVWGFLLEGDI